MIRRAFLAVGCLALFAVSAAAEAADGWTTTTLNLRRGPGTGYSVITSMPAGAHVEVIRCASWCELFYAGSRGYASARYISFSGYRPLPRVIRPPMPPVIYWEFGRPRWDDRYHHWYDGRRWWYDGYWHRRPRSGFHLEFNF